MLLVKECRPSQRLLMFDVFLAFTQELTKFFHMLALTSYFVSITRYFDLVHLDGLNVSEC